MRCNQKVVYGAGNRGCKSRPSLERYARLSGEEDARVIVKEERKLTKFGVEGGPSR